MSKRGTRSCMQSDISVYVEEIKKLILELNQQRQIDQQCGQDDKETDDQHRQVDKKNNRQK